MIFFDKYKLKIVTTVYWCLLLYIVAALFWWFIALNRQNSSMYSLKTEQLKRSDADFASKSTEIKGAYQRKTAQYIGEGVTFFVVILLAAIFIYRATRQQIRLSNQQQNFMMAITHELKTPISITKLNLETLQQRKLNEEKKDNIIAETISEADRLNNLCNNILVASQLEAGKYPLVKETIDLMHIVQVSIDEFSIRFRQRKILLATPFSSEFRIEGEMLLIQLLVNNLIENALKYSPNNSSVVVSLENTPKQVVLKVADEGLGILDSEKKKIFNKFYRGGDENKRKTKGTGLGLFLCKKIVEDHHGKLQVMNNTPQGSIFTATFNKS